MRLLHQNRKGRLFHQKFPRLRRRECGAVRSGFSKEKPVPAELKAQNAILKKEYLAGGYPTVYLLDSEGKKLSDDLGEIKGGVQVFITKLTKLVAKSKNP